jgi:hypothetical protein
MQGREKLSLDHDWEFVRRRASRSWLRTAGDGGVNLPHCWNERDAFQPGLAYYRGWGSYRRTFSLDANPVECADSYQWFLVSEGFYGTGDVWLNGRKLGAVDGQYLGFRFDVTNALVRDGLNRLGIRLTNRCRSDVLPGIRMPDFLLYGGLSGRIWLERIPMTHIEDVCVRTQVGTDGQTVATIDHAVVGADVVGCRLAWRILDASGVEVAGVSVPLKRGRVDLCLVVPDPQVWDVDAPCLYQAEGAIWSGETIVDRVTLRFGVRSAEFRYGAGFFLNGRRVWLRGCNRHESMPGFGRALPLWMHREDAELIKAMGLNFVRLSHYPQHPSFLDACDELGILVYAEIASWKSVRGGRWLTKACRQMEDMVRRDRHHPSVILWGMGNEGRHRRAYRRLHSLCKQLDPDRAVTYAENHLYRARRKGTLGIPDVWGVNYELESIDEAARAARLNSVVISECSNYPHTERGNRDAEQQQIAIMRRDLSEIESKPSVAGFALWCFNDYATLRKERFRRYSGVVDAWRLPKASAYWLSLRFGGSLVSPVELVEADNMLTVTLRVERCPLQCGDRQTTGVRLTVADGTGRPCRWNGNLRASVSGPARLRCFDADGTVPVSDGTGRCFVTATGQPGRIVLTVGGGAVASAVTEIEAV